MEDGALLRCPSPPAEPFLLSYQAFEAGSQLCVGSDFELYRKQDGAEHARGNNPQILILDEPTAGLDPKERVRFCNLISVFAENRIVILSTHIVSDVEYIAIKILIMKNFTDIFHFGGIEYVGNCSYDNYKFVHQRRNEYSCLSSYYLMCSMLFPVLFDFKESVPVLQKLQEICPIFMLHINRVLSVRKMYMTFNN